MDAVLKGSVRKYGLLTFAIAAVFVLSAAAFAGDSSVDAAAVSGTDSGAGWGADPLALGADLDDDDLPPSSDGKSKTPILVAIAVAAGAVAVLALYVALQNQKE